MDALVNLPWHEMLVPSQPLQMIVRGTLSYLGILLILKVILKRQSGHLASSDLLVTVLIADAIQNSMAGEYKSITDGLILVTTIVCCDFLVDWLAYRTPILNRLLMSDPLPLVINGKMQRKNMRKELITEEELWTKLREENVDTLIQIKRAYLENDGEISVIKK